MPGQSFSFPQQGLGQFPRDARVVLVFQPVHADLSALAHGGNPTRNARDRLHHQPHHPSPEPFHGAFEPTVLRPPQRQDHQIFHPRFDPPAHLPTGDGGRTHETFDPLRFVCVDVVGLVQRQRFGGGGQSVQDGGRPQCVLLCARKLWK